MGKYTKQCFFGEPLTKEVFQSFLSCCHLNLLSAQRIIIFECTKNNHIRSIVAFSTTYSKVCCGQLKCLFQFQTDIRYFILVQNSISATLDLWYINPTFPFPRYGSQSKLAVLKILENYQETSMMDLF